MIYYYKYFKNWQKTIKWLSAITVTYEKLENCIFHIKFVNVPTLMFVTYNYNHLLFLFSDPRFPDPGKVEFVFGNNSEGLVQGMNYYQAWDFVPSTLHQNALITTETASKCTHFQ